MYAAQASATAESAVGARTSTSAMCESPSGGARSVAGPRTEKVQPAGAMKVAPAVVCLGASAEVDVRHGILLETQGEELSKLPAARQLATRSTLSPCEFQTLVRSTVLSRSRRPTPARDNSKHSPPHPTARRRTR